MKVLDKIALVLFSSIILIVSILTCFVIFGWIKLDVIVLYIEALLNDNTASNIALGLCVLFILLGIKGIFFSTETPKNEKNLENGILIQNENGKLLISRDTIQNLVSGAVQSFENTHDVTSKVDLTSDNNINIDVTLFVEEQVPIKDLSNKLQVKIKEVIKKSLDIEIKEVNVKVKNIAPKQEAKIND